MMFLLLFFFCLQELRARRKVKAHNAKLKQCLKTEEKKEAGKIPKTRNIRSAFHETLIRDRTKRNDSKKW